MTNPAHPTSRTSGSGGLTLAARMPTSDHLRPSLLARPAQGPPAARAPRDRWQAGQVIIGIGADMVDIGRFEAALRRTPGLAARLFTESERCGRPESLSATFAAKEAVAKALGAPAGLSWTDVEVIRDASGCPRLEIRGTVAGAASQRGIRHWHVSLSHDAGMSIAMVVAEG